MIDTPLWSIAAAAAAACAFAEAADDCCNGAAVVGPGMPVLGRMCTAYAGTFTRVTPATLAIRGNAVAAAQPSMAHSGATCTEAVAASPAEVSSAAGELREQS